MAKLTITKCVVQGGQVIERRSESFAVTINPADYKHSHSIAYTGGEDGDAAPLGKAGATTRFNTVNAEKVVFSIVLDGTGVVADAKGRSVGDQVGKLKALVYDYDGETHEPNIVKLSWGKGLDGFIGRLTSLDIDYTLFHPSGEALRAKLGLSFVSYETPKEEAAAANRSSPDLSHLVVVRAGDTLPLLCQRIYQDPSRYLAVARHNDLDDFRQLTPGVELDFPPMR